MMAPTEAEIRATIEGKAGLWDDVADSLYGLPRGLWGESGFRPSEQECLDQLVDEAIFGVRDRIRVEATEALVAACVTFAEEHPYAPRAQREAEPTT